MERIYYVPEGLSIDEDILFKAKESNCSQVVIGKSDLVNQYIQDESLSQIVFIPEDNTLYLQQETFEQGEEVEVYYLNEWLIYEPMSDLRLELHLVDMEDPKIVTLVEEHALEKEGDIRFTCRFIPKTFGEYILKLYDSQGFLYSRSMIVYKKIEKETVLESVESDGPRFEI